MNPAELNLNPISQLNIIVLVAAMVIFAVTFLVLRRAFVLPYLQVMEERERFFELADQQDAEGVALLRSADLEAEQALIAAAKQAEQIRAEARERTEAYRRETLETAGAEAAVLLEKGRTRIEADLAEETALLRTQAIACVELACGQLLGSSLNGDVEAAVDRLMARHVQ